MKKALVRCDGFITDLVEPGEEFEVYTGPGSGLKWIDIPDDANDEWKLELGEWIPDFEFHNPATVREVAYGDPGLQLSMLYSDIKNGVFGDAAKEGEFFKHIANVKATCAPVEYEDVVEEDENGEQVTVKKQILPDAPFPHDENMPAWMTPLELDDETQREFKIGVYAPDYNKTDAN